MPRRPRVVPSSNIGPVSTDECVIRFTGIGVDRIPPLQGPNLKDSTDIGAFGRGGPSPGEPVLPAVPGGFTLDDFVIDHDEQAVTCPAGHTRPITPTRTVTLGKLCTGCPLRAKCTTAKTGRSMTIHQHEGLLRAARAQGRTPEFKQAYPTRSNVETDRRPRRHPERAPDQAAPPGCRGEQRLAAYYDSDTWDDHGSGSGRIMGVGSRLFVVDGRPGQWLGGFAARWTKRSGVGVGAGSW